MRFLVNGSIAYDLLLSHDGSFLSGIDAKNLEHLSVNYLAQGFVRHHGGTAANIGWHLALLGHSPVLSAAVGLDGTEYVKKLKDAGVDVSIVETRNDAVTAMAVIATDSDERQISFFHPGADGQACFPTTLPNDLSYAIMSPRNPLLMLQGAEACTKNGVPYLFDPGQVVHAFGCDEFRHAVRRSAGLVVNEYEWSLASKLLGWKEADVTDACRMLIITLGENGLKFITRDGETTVAGCKAEHIVNPTGAGDAARAGLLHGLAAGWSLQDTGRLAAILGSLVVSQAGTLLPSLSFEELQARAQKQYGEALPLFA
jgi:adenosine kinase